MKIAIDILTPKQCMFFFKLSFKLESRGHKVLRTTRKYREVNQLLALKGIDAKVVGEHGGGNLVDKLKASAQRIFELTTVMNEFKPDVAVSFSSPEMTRTAYGLGVPHVCINDSPHAEAVARLTIPLSAKLLTPKIIPKKAWTKYGISPDKIIQYDALDPWVWLKDFRPDHRIISQLGLNQSKPIMTFRTEETFASYLLDRGPALSTTIPLIKMILKKRSGIQVVAVPRYEEQKRPFLEVFGDAITVCESIVDGPSLLSFSTVFVGGGGTMTTESALLGVPTFSCYPGEPFLMLKYLVNNRLVLLERDPDKLLKKITSTLDDLATVRKMQSERVQRLVKDFEDPIEVIIKEVENFS
jgi:predicted glycosyltransferase